MKNARNNRGSALLMVLIVGAALGFGITAMLMFVPQMNRQRVESRNILEYNTILASAVEYMRYAIRERWVLTETGAQQKANLPTTLEEMVTHPRALERLLISELSLTHPLHGYNVRRTPPRPIDDRSALLGTATNPFEIQIDFDDLGEEHPLFLVADLKRAEAGLKGIRFRVDRVRNVHYPNGGRGAVFLKIRADLIKTSASTRLLLYKDNLWAEGIYGYFPREINSFALMAAGDIHLEKSGAPVGSTPPSGVVPPASVPVPQGDIVFPKVSKRSDLAKNSTGLLFLSPVYANGSIILPEKNKGWNPTTFGDVLVLGNGRPMELKNNMVQDWYPGGAGASMISDLSDPEGEDRLGGFRKGIKVDGKRDRGLDVLFGVSPGIPPDLTLMNQCIELSKAFTDLQETQNSMLAIRQNGPPTTVANPVNGEYKFRLAMTGANLFAPQGRSGVVAGVFKNNEVKGQNVEWANAPEVSYSTHPNPVIRVSVDFSKSGNAQNPSNSNIQANLSFDSTLKVKFEKPDLGSLNTAVTKATNALNDLQNDLTNAKNDLSDIDASLPSLQQQFDDLKAQLDSTPPPPPAELVDDVEEAEKKLNDAKNLQTTLTSDISALESTKIPSAQAALTSAQEALTKANKNVEFEIDTDPVVINGEEQPNLLDVTIRVGNEDVLVDSALKDLLPTIFIEGYDLGFDGTTTNLRSAGNGLRSNLTRIAFTRSGGRLAPPANIGSSWVTSNPNGEPSGGVSQAPDEVSDRTTVYQACAAPAAVPDWEQDLSGAAQSSWNFTQQPSVRVFDQGDSTWLPVNGLAWKFPKESIVDTCEIRPGAELVTGFFVCNRLRITGPRTKPLRIIGTFIVGRLDIDPSAVKHGITWSSIFHPNAIMELRAMNRLGKGQNCGAMSEPNWAMNLPIWHPSPSLSDLVTLYACMPTAVRGKFPEPFTWTEVDPVCAVMGPTTSCTYRDKRFTVLTMSYVNSL